MKVQVILITLGLLAMTVFGNPKSLDINKLDHIKKLSSEEQVQFLNKYGDLQGIESMTILTKMTQIKKAINNSMIIDDTQNSKIQKKLFQNNNLQEEIVSKIQDYNKDQVINKINQLLKSKLLPSETAEIAQVNNIKQNTQQQLNKTEMLSNKKQSNIHIQQDLTYHSSKKTGTKNLSEGMANICLMFIGFIMVIIA